MAWPGLGQNISKSYLSRKYCLRILSAKKKREGLHIHGLVGTLLCLSAFYAYNNMLKALDTVITSKITFSITTYLLTSNGELLIV